MVAWKSFTPNLRTVLIISNDIEKVSEWRTLFHEKNCHMIHERSPQAALESAKYFPPALIVLDLDLPQPEKQELCRKLRTATHGTLLLLSPSSDKKYLFDYLHIGVDEHIFTPVSPMALLVKSMAWLVRQEYSVPV